MNIKVISGLVVLVLVGGGIFFLQGKNSLPEVPGAYEEPKSKEEAPKDNTVTSTVATTSSQTASSTPTSSKPQPTIPTTPKPTSSSSGSAGGGVSTSSPKKTTFTMAEVANHNSETSCYSVVRGNVYDLTNWIKGHPGGPKAILNICGIDGTEEFVEKHGGEGRPETTLSSFKIGTLVQ